MGKNTFIPDIQLLIYLFLCFSLMYAIEAVTHEGAHYLAAKAMGHKHPSIHYKWTDTGRNALLEEYRYFRKRYKNEIKHRQHFPEQARYAAVSDELDSRWETALAQRFTREYAIICLAGPLETILTGLAGTLMILLTYKKFKRAEQLTFLQWLAVFMSFFWSLPVISFIVYCLAAFIPSLSDMSSDVFKVCLHFGLNMNMIYSITGVIGMFAIWLTFKAVPPKQRMTLLAAAMAGGPLGILLWNKLGPILLP